MELYKSKFIEITFDRANKNIKNKWFPITEQMSDEEYKSEMLKFADLAKEYKPTYHLIHSLDFKYTITIEMQEWTNFTIFPQLIEVGVKKIAFLVSSEIVAQMAIEQTLDESNASAFQVKYFDKEVDACAWFKE